MKSSQESKRVETSAEIRTAMWAAFPPRPEHNRKGWLRDVARVLGWKHRRVKALFYCEARVVTADEWRTLNQRLDALKNAERRHEEHAHELRTAYRMAREGVPVAERGPDPMGLGPAGAGHPRSAARRSA